MTTVTIVVSTAAGHDALLACLRSVEQCQSTQRTQAELLLVDLTEDDAEGRATRALIAAVQGDVRSLRALPGEAPTAAVRRAVAEACTELVVVLDPSTTVAGAWLDALLAQRAARRTSSAWSLDGGAGTVGTSAPGAVLIARQDREIHPSAPGEQHSGAPRAERILLVPNAYAPSSRGGVETYVALLASALQGLGRQVLVLHPHRDRARPDYEVQRDVVEGVPVVRVNRPVNLWHQEHGDERFELLFAQLLRDERIDVVHFHHLCDGLSPSLVEVARGQGVATALTLHDAYTSCAKGHAVDAEGRPCSGATSLDKCVSCVVRSSSEAAAVAETRIALRQRAMEACVRSADLVTAPSRYIADLTAAAPWAEGVDVEVRPLGLDVAALGGRAPAAPRAPGERLRVVVLGNVRTHPSGTDTKGGGLVAAMARALPGVDVAVHGGTDAAFEALAASIPNLTVHGPYHPSQRADLLRGAHCLVVASPVESFCFVAREARAVGVPVISSDGGALPEAVEHEVDGLLFTAGDPAMLAAAVQRLHDDDALRMRLASARRPLLDIDDDATGWADTYDDLVAPGRARLWGHGTAISVVVGARGAQLATVLEALDHQTLPRSTYEVLTAEPAPTSFPETGDPDWAAAVRRAQGPVVLLLDGQLVPSRTLLVGHLDSHLEAQGAWRAVVGPTAASTEVLHDARAQAWLRTAGAVDSVSLRDGQAVPATAAGLISTSLPRELLLQLLDAGAAQHPRLVGALLEQHGVPVHHSRRASLLARSVPAAEEQRRLRRERGLREARLADLAPGLAALLAVDDLEERSRHLLDQVDLAGRVVDQLGGVPLSQLRALPASLDGGDQVPADVLLAAALDVLLEQERVAGASAPALIAVTRSA